MAEQTAYQQAAELVNSFVDKQAKQEGITWNESLAKLARENPEAIRTLDRIWRIEYREQHKKPVGPLTR